MIGWKWKPSMWRSRIAVVAWRMATSPLNGSTAAHAWMIRSRYLSRIAATYSLVLVERQPLRDRAGFQQRVLHDAQRFHVDAAVGRSDRQPALVDCQHDVGAPAELGRRDPRRFLRVGLHELERLEHRADAPPHLLGVLLDLVLRRILDEADPLRRDRLDLEDHLPPALRTADAAVVAPDEGSDLLAGQRGELSVEPAEAEDLHVAVGIPDMGLERHPREDPRRRARPRDTDRLALELTDGRAVGRRHDDEVVAFAVRGDHLDRRSGLAELDDVGRAGDADQHLTHHHRLE